MNWDQIRKNWPECKSQVKQHWSKLTDGDIASINGDRTILARRLTERLGSSKDEVEIEIAEFEENCEVPTPFGEPAGVGADDEGGITGRSQSADRAETARPGQRQGNPRQEEQRRGGGADQGQPRRGGDQTKKSETHG